MVINNANVMFARASLSSGMCPCPLKCEKRREHAVNFILQKGICTSNEIKTMLRKKGLGESAIRGNMKFLSSQQCDQIKLLTYPSGGKFFQFPKKGRIYFARTIKKSQLRSRILSFLTPLQKEILGKFSKHHKDIFYFSLYELKKLLPYAGNSVGYAIRRLHNLQFVGEAKIEKTQFYVRLRELNRFKISQRQVFVEDKIEFATVKRVHELIMNLYPRYFISNFRGAIRPKTTHVLTLTGGMTFDAFYKLREPVGKKEFLVVDVYTRIPVNGYTINSFMKKIEWARAGRDKPAHLKDKTFGMIVFRKATRKAFDIANKYGIRFIRLSDIRIDYNHIRKEIESSSDFGS